MAFSNLATILKQSAVMAVCGAGATFVILTGSIDLSVGSIIGLAGVLAAGVFDKTSSLPLAMLAGIGAGVAIGTLNGVVHAIMKVPSFIATLGTMAIARALCTVYTKGVIIPIPLNSPLKMLGIEPWLFIVSILIITALYVIFRFTVFGRYTRMIGGNEAVARLSGINVTIHKMLVFMLCGFCAGLAGILQAARLGAGSPNTGSGFETEVISAVVLGGTPLSGGVGGVAGTIIGAITLALISNGLVFMGVPTEIQNLIKGVILIIAVFISIDREKIGIIK